MRAYFDEFWCDQQFGFRSGTSTVDALYNVVSDIQSSRCEREVSAMALVDVAKAFDSIPHDILLRKLRRYGVIGTELSWLESYLSDREQIVDVRGSLSEKMGLSSGVPQRSVLGPTLFLIFINDLPYYSQCKVTMYADDTTLEISASNPFELETRAQLCMDAIVTWFDSN